MEVNGDTGNEHGQGQQDDADEKDREGLPGAKEQRLKLFAAFPDDDLLFLGGQEVHRIEEEITIAELVEKFVSGKSASPKTAM